MEKIYMLRIAVKQCVCLLLLGCPCFGQVDTSYVYKSGLPYGTLDIRIAKSATRYYYLQVNKTFSFRESSPGVKTNSYRDMTSWDSSPYTQGNLREKNGTNDYFIMNYRLLFPQEYQASYSPGYPMIVMMHGAGERGNCWDNNCYHDDRSYNPNTNDPPAPTNSGEELLNNDHNLLHGGKPHLDARNLAGTRLPDDPSMPSRAFPGFVLFPQNLNGWNSGTVQDAIKLVRLVAKKYNIDEDRIYIHGLSNGGIGVYESIKRAPWLFAAALPMSAPSDAGIIGQNQTPNIAHIPLWIFQGGEDTAPSPNKTIGYVDRFRREGAVVKLTVYSNLGHGVWNTAYAEKDFFKWMLTQTKANIHVFGGSYSICTTTDQGVRMEVAKGFRKYQWQKNGATISGATGAEYVANSTGTYRVRFSRVPNPSESQWNEWSDPVTVTSYTPPQPQIAQTGTVMLKDLNNYNYAHLYSEGESDRYYWYKDGALQNLYGNIDDTTRYVRFAPGDCSSGACAGNGKYTLVTKSDAGCPSPASKPIQVYFSNQAPTNISAPTNFTGQPSSLTTVKLNWNESSTNESGFEIWRRKVISGTTYTKWEMRTLTGANTKTFTDAGVEPSATYHYKIRAVSNGGRSNYTPAASNAYLVVQTSNDNIDPSAPTDLTAVEAGIRSIKLTWKASTDNTGIQQYRIYYGSQSTVTGSDGTTYTLTGLALNTSYTFTVRAEDFSENLSGPSNSASADTYVEGLYYDHTTGSWTDLDQINWSSTPEYTGHVSNFSLVPRSQDDYFNFEFHGYLYIENAGSYQFQTTSDDGSRLTLDDNVLVENDGLHGNRTITSALTSLAAGPRIINVKYFEATGGQNLVVRYKGPDTGNNWINIPNSALRSGSPPSTMFASTAREAENDEAPPEPLSLTVFPNPASVNDLHFQVDTRDNVPIVVRMIDFTGREVYRSEVTPEQVSSGMQIVPEEAIMEGIYVLIATQNGNTTMRRVSVKN